MATPSKPKTRKKQTAASPSFSWQVPRSLKVPSDPLQVRLDFHEQAVVMRTFGDDESTVRVVSAMDVAKSLASGLTWSSGILPEGALWWANTSKGPEVALYQPAQVRKLALQKNPAEKPRRFTVPLPGLIFICRPGKPPAVYAVKKRPVKATDEVFNAPLYNLFEKGTSCPGSHKYPADIAEIPDSFFRSFFSLFNQGRRSKKYEHDIEKLWESLDGKDKYLHNDLMYFASVSDLMNGVYDE